jgi:hypothetical protein
MHERVQAIERGVHAERQMRMEQEAREVAAEVDKFFDSLPAEWEDTFGKGPGDQLDPNGLLMRNRKALCQEGAGRSPRTNNGRYPSIPCTQIDRAKLIADLGLKQTQAVAAPTQRKAPPKSTNAEIDEYLDEWALSKGYQPAPVATSEGF